MGDAAARLSDTRPAPVRGEHRSIQSPITHRSKKHGGRGGKAFATGHGICTSLHRAGTDPRTPLANSLAAGPLIRFRSPLHPSNGPSCEMRVPVVIGTKVETNMTTYQMNCYRSRSWLNRSTPCYFSCRRPLQIFVAYSIPPAAVDGDRPARGQSARSSSSSLG
jgi:hypothetical protein